MPEFYCPRHSCFNFSLFELTSRGKEFKENVGHHNYRLMVQNWTRVVGS